MLSKSGFRHFASPYTIALVLLVGASTAQSQPVRFDIVGLEGMLDPFTYTDPAGTFTTGPVTLSLSGLGTSFIMYDGATGDFFLHDEMTIAFNDGKPGGGTNLSGLLTYEEIGVVFNVPFSLPIASGTILGAGPFDGTTFFGFSHHTSWGPGAHTMVWNPGEAFFDPLLPIMNNRISITGGIAATFIPEPSALFLLIFGGLSIMNRRRK